MLPDRWNQLEPHPEQGRLCASPARFKVTAAGRRSGKTELAMRRLHEACMDPPRVHRPLYVACAPTRQQAKDIFWQHLKDLAPRRIVRAISETDLAIFYHTGATLKVVGLDKPQRAEGVAIDGAVIDEYAECKPEAWENSIRPALSTRGRPGWAWFIGRPKGRNHFYDLWRDAGTKPEWREEWDAFHWTSEGIIDQKELESAKRDLDPLSYAQEYLADWVNFAGLAYYQWNPALHCKPVKHDPRLPLVFCFDFNVDPGVAVVLQEQSMPCLCDHGVASGETCRQCKAIVPPLQTTCCIGEVHIPHNSNTPAVCNRLAKDWAHHTGEVLYYGDQTGGNRGTAKVEGTDWDLVRQYLKPHFGPRLRDRVHRKNPPERDRVNAMNSRLKAANGTVRMAVNPSACPQLVKDFEGVTLLEGGSGELDKEANDGKLTHLTDALGYYVHERHPIGGHVMRIGAM